MPTAAEHIFTGEIPVYAVEAPLAVPYRHVCRAHAGIMCILTVSNSCFFDSVML